jgi:hypothetical protein
LLSRLPHAAIPSSNAPISAVTIVKMMRLICSLAR